MLNLFYSWRFYKFGREQYNECMGKMFINNLATLRQANIIIAIFVGCFSIYPLVTEKDFLKTGVYVFVALVALVLALTINYKMQTEFVNSRFVYILTTLYFLNLMMFGTYLNVWSMPDRVASIYYCFLICALLMFIGPPLYNFFLILGSMIVFAVSTILIKNFENALLDVTNVVITGGLSLFFNWHISRLRLGLELSANMLEDERNRYMDQSTVDELTKMKNRRDFLQTFQRYLSNYRTSDDWLCVAIADIDFFKFYNDHYGHPMGDDCLRSVGGALNGLKESKGVYAARVGGEEFAMLWFEKDASHVDDVVSFILEQIKVLKIPHEKSKVAPHVTLSIGIYVVRCGSTKDTQTLYDLADKGLYTAKESGRNRAVVYGDEIKRYQITPE